MFTSSDQDKPTKDKVLRGLGQIAYFACMSESTLRRYHKNNKFPMYKVGGNWESTEAKITEWKKAVRVE